MRTARAFVALTLAIPFALLACASDKRSEASSPSNTATYEQPSPAPTAAPAPGEPGAMQPAFGINDADRSTMEGEQPAAPAPEPAKTPALTDEQIAAVMDAAHGAEIDQAKLAIGKTKNARVKKFAQMMIDDHKKAKQDQSKLMTKLGMTTSSSPKLEQFKTSAADTDRTLRGASVDTFDKVYIELQVADHQMVVDTLDRDFIPNTQNPELRKALEEFRPKVAHHLDQALEIQKTLMSSPSSKTGSGTAAPGATPNTGMK